MEKNKWKIQYTTIAEGLDGKFSCILTHITIAFNLFHSFFVYIHFILTSLPSYQEQIRCSKVDEYWGVRMEGMEE